MAMQEFGSQCMVKNYEEKFYARAAKNYHILLQNSAEAAKALKLQYERLVNLWKGIKVDIPLRDANGPFRVGENFRVSTVVRLGELRPDEVDVELYYGSMKSIDTLSASSTQPMHVEEDKGDGTYLYSCSISCNTAGRFGFTVRVTPRGDQRIKFNPHFLTWAN
jgi:glycogen phosphorylase